MNPLEIGLHVQLRPLETATGAGGYRTRVEELSDTAVLLQRPTEHFRPVFFPPGARIEISFTRTEPPGKAGRYRAETEVIDVVRRQVPLLRLRLPEQWERAQAREFFRVPAGLPCRVRRQDDADDAWLTGTTRDISGGGCQIVLPERLRPGDEIDIELELPDGLVPAVGSVRRADDVPLEAGLWAAGIKFEQIDDKHREAVIQFAFQRQIQLRRKGMA